MAEVNNKRKRTFEENLAWAKARGNGNFLADKVANSEDLLSTSHAAKEQKIAENISQKKSEKNVQKYFVRNPPEGDSQSDFFVPVLYEIGRAHV